MDTTTVAVDLAKNVFQLAVADQHWKIVERHRLTRGQFERWFANRSVGRVVMEACGSAHHWARWLSGLGIEVRLLPAPYVRAYVKRNKTDAHDAAAICEAVARPTMRFVPIKTTEQQAALMLVGVREQLVRRRTQLSNAIRGYAAEFGLIAAKGLDKIEPLLARMIEGPMSTVVPLKVCELLAPVLPFRITAAKLKVPRPAFSPPRVNAELLERMLLAGAVAGAKSSVMVPFSMTVGPVYVFAPERVRPPKLFLVRPAPVPSAITPP